MIDTLISSKTRVKLLLKFFLNSSNTSYLRNLEEEFGESTNAIRLELNKFESAGLLKTKTEGNKKLFKVNTHHTLFSDIHNIIKKFVGIDKIIDVIASKLGQLDYVYLIGNLARGLNADTIEIVLVGEIDIAYLEQLIAKAEKEINKKVKYFVYKPSAFSESDFMNNTYQPLLLWSKQ
jgi:hypothetical protein